VPLQTLFCLVVWHGLQPGCPDVQPRCTPAIACLPSACIPSQYILCSCCGCCIYGVAPVCVHTRAEQPFFLEVLWVVLGVSMNSCCGCGCKCLGHNGHFASRVAFAACC
jgi:hypothetical protein